MMTRCKTMVVAALVVFLAGCATIRPKVSVLGRPVEVQPAAVKGELLAVGAEQLWIKERDEVREVPLAGIEQVKVKRHDLDGKRGWAWALIGAVVTGAVLTASCASVEDTSCGSVPLAVAGTWLALGGVSAASLERSSKLEVRGPNWEVLKPYARFPQGLPEELDPKSLAQARSAPKPDSP